MSGRSWASSGRRAAGARKAARPDGSWGMALERARESWDGLTGGPAVVPECDCGRGGPAHDVGCAATGRVYSDVAAAAILAVALGLWPDTAALVGEG